MNWKVMSKDHIRLAHLVEQFHTHCRLERKSDATTQWYADILRRFLQWAGDISLEEFTLDRVRGYLGFLQSRPRYAGHPTTPSDGQVVSAATFRHHAVTLRVFSRWLHDEEYTREHRLGRLKTPKVPETVVDILTDAEIKRLLASQALTTPTACRNHSMLVLALDTGLRLSEIVTLDRRNLDLDQGVLTAFGKGSKERLVPFGYTVTKTLTRYVLHFRPEAALPQHDRVFLQESGRPLTKAAMEMLAKRMARKAGIERFHWHLLRHTFAVNYLINGGDPFSLQLMLGHTTLEMVRRYMHLADVHVRLQHRRYSPMDMMHANSSPGISRDGRSGGARC